MRRVRLAVPATIVATIVAMWCSASALAAGPLAGASAVDRDQSTGAVSFVGTDAGDPLAFPDGVDRGDSARAIALAYAADLAKPLGLDAAGGDVRVLRVLDGAAGGTSVRLQQLDRGLPVVGGELAVDLGPDGRARAVLADTLPQTVPSTEPSVSAAAAAETAIGVTARARDADPATLVASEPVLSVYDARLLGGPGLEIPVLVWRTEVTTTDAAGAVRELVLVDAKLGGVALNFSQIAEAKDRRVCDAGSTESDVPCLPAGYVREEGDPPTGDADTDLAYDYAGETYDMFFGLGRDSLDDAGLPLISTVHYCDAPNECPNYLNAFWNGEQMVYGNGFSQADDVVGHELGHGVTDFSSHLFYYYQSGAINESLSDVFGEFVDLTNSSGTDTPASRWKLGEDVPSFGALRDMEDPTFFGDPDRMSSPNYVANPNTDLNTGDSGGVHSNSGVNNKAAFLMTDGATFNGQTVAGIGIPKALRIYYHVNNDLLLSGSDYADLAAALVQSCNDLVGTAGITAANCTEVGKAVAAVEMAQPPTNAPATDPPAPSCPTGQVVTNLFNDDLENPGSGNWAAGPVAGTTNEWYYPQTDEPYDFGADYSTSGVTNMWGLDTNVIGDYAIAMTSSVPIPDEGATFRFKHSYGFESIGVNLYDGGVLEYSTNGGASWQDAGSLITFNGYDGTLNATFGNPLGGRMAFAGDSTGYIGSSVNLNSLAGESVRFRFRIGTDDAGEFDYGWFIDDPRIYTCASQGPSEECLDAQAKVKKAKNKVKKAKNKVKKAEDNVKDAKGKAEKKKAKEKLKKAKEKLKKAKKKLKQAKQEQKEACD